MAYGNLDESFPMTGDKLYCPSVVHKYNYV